MNENEHTPRNINPRDVLLNALSSYGGNLVDIAVFLLLLPFIIDSIGTQSFGLWSLVWAIVTTLSLMDLGFGQTVVKFVAGARGKSREGDRGDRNQRTLVCTLFWIHVAQMIGILVLLGLIWLLFEDLFEVEGRVEEARMILLIVGGGFAMSVPFGMFRGILIAHQKQWLPNLYRILATVIYAVLVLVVLRISPELSTLAFLNLIVTVGPLAAVTVHARVTLPGLSLRLRHFDRTILRDLWSHSFYFLIINFAALVYTRVDTFIIQAALNLTAVAMYALAMRVSDQVESFCLHVARTLTPVVAELHGAEEKARLIQVWLFGTKVAVAIGTPLVIGCVALARPLVVHWTGNEFLDAVPVLQILLLSVFVNVIHSNSHILLSMRGRQRYLAFALLGAQCANAALSIALVGTYGILGVAVATILTNVPFQVFVIQGKLKAVHNLSLSRFYGRTLLPSAVPLAAMLAALWTWNAIHTLGGLAEVALCEGLGCLVFWATFWGLGFGAEERTRIRGILRKIIRKREGR